MATDKKPKKPDAGAPKKSSGGGGGWFGRILLFSGLAALMYLGGYLALRINGSIRMPTRHEAHLVGDATGFFAPAIWVERQLRGLGAAAGTAAEHGGKALRETVQ
jgi:hypothetical protein